MKLGLIVEGHGEVFAGPVLVRRVATSINATCNVLTPLRVPRASLPRAGELERHVTLLGDKVGVGGAILVLLDSDDDPACQLGPALLARATKARSDRAIAVVLAVREFEAWFLAAAQSLAGRRGLPDDLVDVPNAEQIRDAKRWLDERMPRGYRPTNDQAALAALVDLAAASRAPSFAKLVRELTRLVSSGST